MALKILAQKAVDDKNVKRVDRYIVIGREGMLQVVSKIPLGLYRTTDIRIEKTPTEINEKTNENIDCRISFSTRSDAFFKVKDTDGDDVYIIHWLSQKIELCAAMLDG